MKTRHIYIMFLLAGSPLKASAQAPSPGRLLDEVQKNNRTLQHARDIYQAALLEAGTGNTPPDPEVDFGYLFGKPSDMGNRIDFSVSQQVEFPGSYIARSRIRKIRSTQAELEFLNTRQEVLLKAKYLWIERIHLNQLENLLEERLRQAELINDHFRQKMNAGEIAQLEMSQSSLQLAVLQGEYEQVLSDINRNKMAVEEMTYGIPVDILDTILPAPVSIDTDSLLAQYRRSPEYLLYQQEMQASLQEKKLAVNQHLPGFSTGYYSESVLDQKFRGFQLGISVPLWENTNRVKLANAAVIAAESDAERYAYEQEQALQQKLERMENLRYRSGLLGEALKSGESIQLLTFALESGEISLSEYFYATEFYFRNEQQLLEYRKEQLLIEAALLKVYL